MNDKERNAEIARCSTTFHANRHDTPVRSHTMLLLRPEVSLLETALQRAIVDRQGTTLFVTGEPGVGKSTFVERFMQTCDSLHDVNTLTATGRCIDIDGISRGYLPWKEILIELDADRAAGKNADKKKSFKTIVKTLFDESGSEWIQNIPHVGDISAAIFSTAHAIQRIEEIDVTTGESRELSFRERLRHVARECAGAWMGAIPLVGGLAEAIFTTSRKLSDSRRDIRMKNQEDFFILVMSRLRELAKENPIVIFLDDLQWADASSLSLLLYLSKNLHDTPYPLLIIGSYRPEDLQRGRCNPITGERERHPLEEKINVLLRYNACREIALGKFDQTQVRQYVSIRFPDNTFTSHFTSELLRVTGGNALFIQEMLTNMMERGIIERNGDIWSMSSAPDYSLLPRTIEGVIKERYERLSDELRELLQIAAIDGEEFSFEVLEMVMQKSALGLSRGIDSLIERHALIHKSNRVSEQLTRLYAFTHNLVQKYIYYSLHEDFRRDVHRMIADAIRTLADEDEMRLLASEYSFHLGIGEGIIDERRNILLDKSHPPGTKNIREAIERYVHAQKELVLQDIAEYNNAEAIHACDHVVELATIIDDENVVVEYLLKKGSLLSLVGEWEQALGLYSELVARTDHSGDRRSSLEALCQRGILHNKLGRNPEAIKDIEQSLTIARELGNRAGISAAISALGTMLLEYGEHQKALEHFQQALAMSEESGDMVSAAGAISSIGYVYYEWGELDQASECFQRQREIYRKLDDRAGIAATIERLGHVASQRGEYDVALDYFSQALALVQKQGNRGSVALLLGRIGGVHLERGAFDQALDHFRRKLVISRELGSISGIASAIGNMGIIHGARGENEQALACYREVLGLYESLGDRRGISIVIGNMGLIHAKQGKFDQAMECHLRDLEICTELNDRHGISNASAGIGAIYRILGEFDQATECYSRQLEISLAMGDRRGIADARGELGALFLERGDYERSVELLTEALEEQHAIGVRPGEIRNEGLIARALFEVATTHDAMPGFLARLLPTVTPASWRTETLRQAYDRISRMREPESDPEGSGSRYSLRARILQERIVHALWEAGVDINEERAGGVVEPDRILDAFRSMFAEAESEHDRAEVAYWIWKYDPNGEGASKGEVAFHLYEHLLHNAPTREYRKRIEELRSCVPDTRAR